MKFCKILFVDEAPDTVDPPKKLTKLFSLKPGGVDKSAANAVDVQGTFS